MVRSIFLISGLIFLGHQAVLGTEVSDPSIIPEQFHGLWAENKSECIHSDAMTIQITASSYSAYELTARPMIVSGEITWWFEDRHEDEFKVTSVRILTAETGEGQVSQGKMQLSLMDGKLYVSRLESEADEHRLENPLIKCPQP